MLCSPKETAWLKQTLMFGQWPRTDTVCFSETVHSGDHGGSQNIPYNFDRQRDPVRREDKVPFRLYSSVQRSSL